MAKRTIERTKKTMDLEQKRVGRTTLCSRLNIVFNKRYEPTQKLAWKGSKVNRELRVFRCLGNTSITASHRFKKGEHDDLSLHKIE